MIRKRGKEGIRKGLVRVQNSVRHAQAQGLARRIHRAAELRTRHRALLCAQGSNLRGWRAILCAQGAVLFAQAGIV